VRDLVGSTDITRLIAFKDLAELLCELEAAVTVQMRVLEIHREGTAGEEDADVATSLNNLAGLLETQGKYDEAELLYRQSLPISRKVCAIHHVASWRDHSCKVLGEEHPAVAALLNNLAKLLRVRGKYDEAEPLYRQAIGVWRTALGEEHPLVAMGLNNLAVLLEEGFGNYAESERLKRHTLAILRKVCGFHLATSSRDHSCKVLGEEHSHVAASLHNLANVLTAQGKYDEAEPLYQQSLAIRHKVCAIHLVASSRDYSCKVFGEEHLDVAESLNSLAELLRAQGKYDEAESLHRQSLAIRRKVCAIHLVASSRDHSCKVLGEEHPSVAALLNNLAGFLHAQGKYEECIPLLRQSLEITRKVLGEEHPEVAILLNNLAGLLNDTGRSEDAYLCGWQALAIATRAFGPNHPTTKRIRKNWA
jgi:tetratricopeptide (TPR) repeat protein